jgi:hypothetical protein
MNGFLVLLPLGGVRGGPEVEQILFNLEEASTNVFIRARTDHPR